jgi:hypothetical protein
MYKPRQHTRPTSRQHKLALAWHARCYSVMHGMLGATQ